MTEQTADMYDSSASPIESPPREVSRDIRGYFGGQRKINEVNNPGIPAQEHRAMDANTGGEHMSSPLEARKREASSEGEMPIRPRRLCPPSQQAPTTGFQMPDISSTADVEQPRMRKKPGPKPYANKPIAKNDLKAKIEVIRAIEKNWGKNFIVSYIPKCHRPLQKKKGGKRTAFRQHETDPKKWLPSVLKSVHMISNLTNDRTFLRKAFNDIVRHRIKHTGNRKPQLVTTDFDIIEDMLTRGWDVETSFAIRYKHLLLSQPKGYMETDEDIDHILACGDDDFVPVSDNDEDDQEADEDMEDDAQDYEDSNLSSLAKSYLHGPPHQPSKLITSDHTKPAKPLKQEKQEKQDMPPKKSKLSVPPAHPVPRPPPEKTPYQNPYGAYGMPGYPPYGPYSGYPPMPGYPTQQHMKGYPPPPMYPWPGYGQYYPPPGPNKDASPQDSRSQPQAYPIHGFPGMPHYPQPLAPPPTDPKSTPELSSTVRPSGTQRFSPFGRSKRSSSFRPEAGSTRNATPGRAGGPQIKREFSVDEQSMTVEEYDDGPDNYAGEAEDMDDDEMADEEMRIEIAEQERRVQILKAKLAAKKNKM